MQQEPTTPSDTISYLSNLASEALTGEVLFQNDQQSAKVYLNDGLIVWAFASGQKESFQSILIKENLITKEALLEGIRAAREKGKRSLNDILSVLGVSDGDRRNTIIERHTRAALQEIKAWGACVAQFSPQVSTNGAGGGGLGLEKLLPKEAEETRAQEVKNVSAPSATSLNEESPRKVSYGDESEVSSASNINELLDSFRMEVPHFIAAMIIDSTTGMPIATLSDVSELDFEAVSAFYRDLNKSAIDALRAMGKSDGCPMEEVLITSKDDFVVLRTLNEGEQLLYLLIDRDSNPGMARVVVKRYLEQLEGFLS
jgi:predicted regulator of Ras-like GTPase activity (Roadblock/LC7/MglB family)